VISVEITFFILIEKSQEGAGIILTGDDMKEYLKKYWLYGVIGIVIVVLLLLPRETPVVDDTSGPTVEEQVELMKYIFVDLKGEIKNPGVYKLESDARLFQVISLAGGLTEEADPLGINMSILLKDQMRVYVPSIHEQVPMVVTPIDEDPDDLLIDINQAGLLLLETLPGIGPSTAQNIIDYRDEFGYFDVIEDIMNVPNIGESTFENIKEFIIIEE